MKIIELLVLCKPELFKLYKKYSDYICLESQIPLKFDMYGADLPTTQKASLVPH